MPMRSNLAQAARAFKTLKAFHRRQNDIFFPPNSSMLSKNYVRQKINILTNSQWANSFQNVLNITGLEARISFWIHRLHSLIPWILTLYLKVIHGGRVVTFYLLSLSVSSFYILLGRFIFCSYLTFHFWGEILGKWDVYTVTYDVVKLC